MAAPETFDIVVPASAERPHAQSLHVLQWGKGRPCVFLHGLGDVAGIWSHIATDVAAQGFRALAFDLPGHGDSGWTAEHSFDPQSVAAAIHEALRHLGHEAFDVVGHSIGAEVAIWLARLARVRLGKLILIDYGPQINQLGVDRIRTDMAEAPDTFPSVEDYRDWLLERRPLAREDVIAQFAHYHLRRLGNGRHQRKLHPALMGWRRHCPSRAANGRQDLPELWAALRDIACPALVLRGVASAVLPMDVARKMASEVLPNGNLAVIPKAGHAVMMDNPEAVSEAVTGFLR